MAMKYVRHRHAGFILFPDCACVWHSRVGKWLGVDNVMSAGFVEFTEEGPQCYGYSESLDIGSREDDTEKLRIQINTGIAQGQ